MGVSFMGRPLEGISVRRAGPTTYIPLRAVCESLGYTVTWDSETQSVMVQGKGRVATFKAGSSDAIVDLQTVAMSADAIVDEGTTWVPAEAMHVAFGHFVTVDDEMVSIQ